jgi:hypothetical protein
MLTEFPVALHDFAKRASFSSSITDILSEMNIDLDQPLTRSDILGQLHRDWYLEREATQKPILKALYGRTLREFTLRMDAALETMPYAMDAVGELYRRGIHLELARHIDVKEKLLWMLIMETLVSLSDDDIGFLQAAYDEYKEKIDVKLHLSQRPSALRMLSQGYLFTYIKYLTVDSSMRFRLRMQTELDPLGYFRKKRLIRFMKLPLNIMEASLTDFLHGHWKNAWTGWLLALSPVHHYAFDPNKKRIIYEGRAGYEEPYLLWNLTFCLRTNSSEIHRVIPKLFFPRILSDRSSDFFTSRGLSLWFALQSIFMRRDAPCDEWLTSLSQQCAEVFGHQAWLATRVYKKQMRFEFIRHLLRFYRSEDEE